MNRIPAVLALFLAACSGSEANVKSADPYERYLGVKELAVVRTEAAAAVIVQLLADPHYLVVLGALEAIATRHDPAFFQHVPPLLKHAHPLVRGQACITLGALGDVQAGPVLVQTLADPEATVRREAVKALARLGKRPEVLAALVGAVGDRDPSVSLTAHEKLQELTGLADVARRKDAWEKAIQ
jgi:HEAT repeat protein